MNATLKAKLTEPENLLSLYDETKAWRKLVQAVKARNIKALHDESFLHKVTDRLIANELNGNVWLIILTELIKSYINELAYFAPEIEKKISTLDSNHEYHAARQLVSILHRIGGISDELLHYRLAMLHFNEGMKNWNSMEDYTIYPNMADSFEKAYAEIHKIRDSYPDEAKRLKSWYAKTEKYVRDCIVKWGVKGSFPIDEELVQEIRKGVRQIEINSIGTLIIVINHIPYATREDIDRYVEICSKESPLEYLSRYVKLGRDGQKEGGADALSHAAAQWHSISREKASVLIFELIKYFLEQKIPTDSKGLYELMELVKPLFVPNHIMRLVHLAFILAFEAKYVEMSYVLLPQVEAILRGFAEKFHGNLTKLEKEVNQDKANLTKSLECLKPHFDPVKFEAINLFLNDSAGVNLRNKMSHGLMSDSEVRTHAQFLLKIAIDLYFNPGVFLKTEQTNRNDSDSSIGVMGMS